MIAFSFIVDLMAVAQSVLNWLFTTFGTFSVSLVTGLLSVMGTVMPSIDTSAWTTQFDNLNYFFPLGETITMSIAYFAFYMAVFGYRLLKSWLFGLNS